MLAAAAAAATAAAAIAAATNSFTNTSTLVSLVMAVPASMVAAARGGPTARAVGAEARGLVLPRAPPYFVLHGLRRQVFSATIA